MPVVELAIVIALKLVFEHHDVSELLFQCRWDWNWFL